MTQVSILTIGNEILNGDITNTNSSWLSERLTQLGFSICFHCSVGDDSLQMLKTFNWVQLESDVVIVTGGLGPTHDDITKKVFQQFFNVALRHDEAVFEHVKGFFNKRGLPFSSSNHMQADVLANCDVLFNHWGTAPGMWVNHLDTIWVILPGVPKEMKQLFDHQVLPKLLNQFTQLSVIENSYLSVAGIGESTLADTKLAHIPDLLNDSVSLAYLPHYDGITLRITAQAKTKEDATIQINHIKSAIIEAAVEFIFSDSNKPMSQVVGELANQKNWTIAVAESCTGGGLGSAFTDISGSSTYFYGGVIAYDNSVKQNLLNVSEATLSKFGAVSSQTALEMANGVRKLINTDIGISITGIAGPEGGTVDKPVGTIWFGIATPKKTITFCVKLTKDREMNRKRSVMIAMDALRRILLGIENLPYSVLPEVTINH